MYDNVKAIFFFLHIFLFYLFHIDLLQFSFVLGKHGNFHQPHAVLMEYTEKMFQVFSLAIISIVRGGPNLLLGNKRF